MIVQGAGVRGYDNLTHGKNYEVVDIRRGMFADRPYVLVIDDNNKVTCAHYWRFDITRERCYAYIKDIKDNQPIGCS